jgi:hypothetical protein
MEMLLFFFWVMFAIIVGVAASYRCNRVGIGWFLLSVVISPLLAGLFLIAVGPKKVVEIVPPSRNWDRIAWTPEQQVKAAFDAEDYRRNENRNGLIVAGIGLICIVAFFSLAFL